MQLKSQVLKIYQRVVNNFCYIHIPFCSSKCKYCRFASFWVLDKLKINLYVKYLLKEIREKETDFKNLKSVYFGWWTPSILDNEQLSSIINELKSKYLFDNDIEINIEATPNTISKSNIIKWKKIWINRISMWVQTLNNTSLIEIWRGNKWDIISALDIIKSFVLNSSTNTSLTSLKREEINVSIDFIIWLPYVKKWEIKKDIEFILSNYYFIKHISVYMLEEYYDVPDSKNSKFENIIYPNNWNKIWIKDEDYLSEYIEISNLLKNNWFYKYEISNFAKKWYECRHNQAYWNHSNILAFWLWAHWFVNNERYSNSEEFIEYYSWKNIVKEKLNMQDLFFEKVMFQLRTNWLEKNIIKNLNLIKIEEFINWWYLKKESDKIILSDKWVLVLDYILKEIL